MAADAFHTKIAMCPSFIVWKVKYPLHFIASYVQPVAYKSTKSTSVIKVAVMINANYLHYAKEHIMSPQQKDFKYYCQ